MLKWNCEAKKEEMEQKVQSSKKLSWASIQSTASSGRVVVAVVVVITKCDDDGKMYALCVSTFQQSRTRTQVLKSFNQPKTAEKQCKYSRKNSKIVTKPAPKLDWPWTAKVRVKFRLLGNCSSELLTLIKTEVPLCSVQFRHSTQSTSQ